MKATEPRKLKGIGTNSKTGTVFVFLNATGYDKQYPLKKDRFGYLVDSGKITERFTHEEDIEEITDWLKP